MSIMEVNAKGFDKLERALDELPQKVGKEILEKSLRLGGEVIRSAITVRAPIGTTSKNPGTLRRSITLRPHGRKGYTGNWFATAKGAGMQFDIGPEYSSQKKGYHGHLVEYGTEPHAIVAGYKYGTRNLRGGNFRIKIRGTKKTVLADKKRNKWFGKSVIVSARSKPFLRPGFIASKNAAVRMIHDKLSTGIKDAFERMVD